MKKTLIFILTTILIFTIPFPSQAQEDTMFYTETQYLGNGLYGITTLKILSNNTRASVNTQKSSNKTYTIKDSNGTVYANFTLSATFTYVSGRLSTCTTASYTTDVYLENWSFSNASATYSGNQAVGSFTIQKKIAGVVIQTISDEITLTCDIYGNIS